MSYNDEIINLLLNNIDSLNVYNKESSVEKKVIGNLYNDLYFSYKKVNKLIKTKKMTITAIPVKTNSDIPYTDLLDSHFCVKGFKKDIYEKTREVLVYKISLNDIAITIYLNDISKERNINIYIMKHVVALLDLLLKYANTKTTKTLNIYLYLTDYKKELPNTNIISLNKDNVNTAVTYSCGVNGEILIFRK